MTTDPTDPRFVSYALAVEALEEFEEEHPPVELLRLYTSWLHAAVLYSRRQEGQLAGCPGDCLGGWMPTVSVSDGVNVILPACAAVQTCPAASRLRSYRTLIEEWAHLRARVQEARAYAGLVRKPRGRKVT